MNGNCQLYVNDNPYSGQSVNTLGYLEQHSICKSELFLLCCRGFVLMILRPKLDCLVGFYVNRDDISIVDDDNCVPSVPRRQLSEMRRGYGDMNIRGLGSGIW